MPRFTEKMKLVVQENARHDISRAAIELIRNGGLTAFSMDAVAKKVGMSRSLLYRYFKDKNDILKTILKIAFSDLLDRLESAANTPGTASQRLREISNTFVTDFIHNGNFHRILMMNMRPPKRPPDESDPIHAAHIKYRQIFENVIREGIQNDEFDSGLHYQDIEHIVMGTLHEICFVNGSTETGKNIHPDSVLDIILKGISKK